MKKPAYKWIALTVTTIGSLMAAIDTTIVILALPNMLQDLHSDLVRMTWVIMGYLMVNTVFQLTFGRFADMFGRVRLYNLGFVIFTLGSVLCGFSASDTMLIGARVLQGAGGAMLSANSMAIITEVFPPEQRGQAMGINSITWGAGSVLGPVLGGFILAVASWRWIFLVNLPIGIIGTLAAYLLLHDIAPNPRGERFDLLGALLFCVGLICLLLGLMSSIGAGWFSPMVLSLFAVTIIAFVAFILWERHTPNPILDLHLFDNRVYAFSVAAATLQSLAMFAVNFLLIFYLQGVRGYDALSAAFLILPLPLFTSLISPFGGRWADHDRFKGATPASVGLVIQALALVVLIFLTPTTTYIILALALTLMGLGGALFWSPNTSTTMGAAPRTRLGVASATLNTMRNVGMICSFALALAVAASSMPPQLVNAVFLGTVGHLQASISRAFTDGMSHAFLASVLICVLAIIFSVVRESKHAQSTATIAPQVRSAASSVKQSDSPHD
ncbi:DHA2 family efflux MFS transporter permease subunit [Ktedonosporobacter rubrisoli]|uniref:DHA2 family efflux MFS transporter permease subunit n=1 Tax=Ktedonosporobacter rubrisoli TaxID=2509675 RepID=A0A4P6K4B5_KTERU|nr:MFS transporter [Ktedonosporobacter rubrisoli]QBD83148.1 DHA2 family efflux MFS transporter permease subunit [Ktedonosporobacter rubrisoli]